MPQVPVNEIPPRWRKTGERLGLPMARLETAFAEHARPALLRHLSRFVIPFVRRSGLRVMVVEPGRCVCRMPLRGNVNHIGTMYAGALFTLAEFPGGPLLLATFGIRRYVPIVTDFELSFVKAAKSDVTVALTLPRAQAAQIEADIRNNGRASFELQGELKAANGNVVARSRARYEIRPRR